MTFNTTTMRRGAAYEGIQRGRLPVYQSGEDTGNETLVMDHPMRELFFINDSSTANATVVVSGPDNLSLSFTIAPGDRIDERFPEFDTVTITATHGWRWYVRSGRIT